MSEIFVTGDSHFFHTNIIEYCNRPFRNALSMNRVMIDNWNDMVGKNDIVFHVGDFAWKKSKEIREQLNGRIHLIRGNHDKKIPKGLFETVKDIDVLKIGKKYRIVLCHYAMKVWDRSYHGSWSLYGHSHGTLLEDPCSLSFDIGVDCWEFKPVHIDTIIYKMKKKEKNWKENRGKESYAGSITGDIIQH